MRMHPRDLIRELILAGALSLAAASALATGLLAPFQGSAADALMRLGANRPPDPPAGFADVAVVALDAQSLRAYPAWPWPRRLYAKAIRLLDAAGAKVVAFDIDFSTPREPGDDEALRLALSSSGRVVLAAFRQKTLLPDGSGIEVASLPAAALAAAAARQGSVLVPVEGDGVVRYAPRTSLIAGTPMASLARASLELASGGVRFPSDPPELRLDYRRIRPSFPVIPMVDLIDGRFDPRDVAGRVVLVGATAAEFRDLWSTPLGPARPGVMIQAVAYRTLVAEIAGERVWRAPRPPVPLALAAGLVLAGGVGGLGSHRRRVGVLGALALGTSGAAAGSALFGGVVLDPVLPLSLLGLQYVLGLEGLQRRFGRGMRQRELSLSTLFRVGEATQGSTARGGLELALALLGDVMNAHAVALLRARPDGSEPTLDPTRIEWRREGAEAPGERVGDTALALRVLADRRMRVFEGTRPGGRMRGGLAVYLPLYTDETRVGVLLVERENPAPLDEVQLRTIATVGAQIALFAENLRLIEGLRATLDASVAAIATAIEARDGYTEAHCRRLAAFSGVIALRLGLKEDELEAVRLGALLHDVGKIGIRDEILLKPARLSPEERRDMERHPEIGSRIISGIQGLRPTTVDCVLHHHEWWNGGGYPSGLSGDAIPLGARIVAVVDVWDALSTERPYKRALPPAKVRAHLEKLKGIQFDPAMVDLFLRILDEEGEEMRSLLASPAQVEG
jgi:HD-GYP domain-containing protein (c-di-GMP phosphodiesterase class II)/CHASE2 domain-containing sensor protein